MTAEIGSKGVFMRECLESLAEHALRAKPLELFLSWNQGNNQPMDYDFAVIGGGSAGYAAARTAVSLGLKTAVIEGGKEIGGLCILRGCMPSKTLLESARRFRVLKRAGEFGLSCGTPEFNAAAIIARKNRLISEFAEYRRGQLESGKFDFHRGRAEFLDSHTLRIHAPDGKTSTLQSRTFIISTGSEIGVPPVPGLAESRCLTSDDLLDLESIPESIIILGAGPVGLEMASYCRAFGSRVTIIQRSPQILKSVDPDVASALEESLRRDGIDIFTNTSLLHVADDGRQAGVSFEQNGQVKNLEAARVLNALGRKPRLVGLEPLNLSTTHGRIAVQSHQSTSHAHIFAAGDVCGGLEVVHIAIQQGETAAHNAAILLGRKTGAPRAMDYRLTLFAVFSEPQLASVGSTEAELRASGIEFLAASYPFNDHGKSLVMGETEGFVKLLAHRESGEILGASVVGPEASDLIHEVVVAMNYRATVRDFAAIPHYHPTLSEIWTYPAEEIADQLSPT
jgi:pyruvate/2-oxoglutarate dehydrogenase complex dihydrolipoamide dehydrogenase (E3) component